MKRFFGITQAPSNIALIKYMGKKEGSANIPENESLSLTLSQFCTFAGFQSASSLNETRVFFNGASLLEWQNQMHSHFSFHIDLEKWVHPNLTSEEVEKTNRNLQKLFPKGEALLIESGFSILKNLEVEFRTANTFPASAGIASSASSQASLVLGLLTALVCEKKEFELKFQSDLAFKSKIAALSREASGSSCRSFFGPWVQWKGTLVEPLKKEVPTYSDILILIDASKKKVSSSEAHQNIKTSSQWPGRVERAQFRFQSFQNALFNNNLKKCAHLAFEEALDMHELFHTSTPSFSYFQNETYEVLEWYKGLLNCENAPPFLTMDAGPNIHLVVQSSEVEHWLKKVQVRFPSFKVLVDTQGAGAQVLGVYNE